MLESGRTYVVISQTGNVAMDLSDKDQRSIISYHIQKGDNQRVQSTVAVDLIPTPFQWRFEKHDDGWTI